MIGCYFSLFVINFKMVGCRFSSASLMAFKRYSSIDSAKSASIWSTSESRSSFGSGLGEIGSSVSARVGSNASAASRNAVVEWAAFLLPWFSYESSSSVSPAASSDGES